VSLRETIKIIRPTPIIRIQFFIVESKFSVKLIIKLKHRRIVVSKISKILILSLSNQNIFVYLSFQTFCETMHKILPEYSLPGEQKAVKLPLTTNKYPLSNTPQLRSNNPAITQYLHTDSKTTPRQLQDEL
jgi:hypothetical protein